MSETPFNDEHIARGQSTRLFQDPKKHYVRMCGWLPVLRLYSRRCRDVRYLTLCSKQAIDVRYFAQKNVLRRNEDANEYPTLTFIESQEEDYATIVDTLGSCRLPILGKLEDVLLDASHPSHYEFLDSFPYDVINLDFCGELIGAEDYPYSSTIQCIDRLIQLQVEASYHPDWSMFITFRAQRDRANEEASEQLKDIIEQNLTQSENRAAYQPRRDPSELLNEDYSEFLRIGFTKLIASRASASGYKMTLESCWKYKRGGGRYEIVKVILRFQRLYGVGELHNPEIEREEYKDTVRLIFTSAVKDVDEELVGNEAGVERDLEPVIKELEDAGVL